MLHRSPERRVVTKPEGEVPEKRFTILPIRAAPIA
jgi:hypothetical protein